MGQARMPWTMQKKTQPVRREAFRLFPGRAVTYASSAYAPKYEFDGIYGVGCIFRTQGIEAGGGGD